MRQFIFLAPNHSSNQYCRAKKTRRNPPFSAQLTNTALVQRMAEEVLWPRPYVLVINEKLGSIRVEGWQCKKIPVIQCFAAGPDRCTCGKSPAPQHQHFQRAGREGNLTCALTRFYLKVK
jgi:hypothetical protein